MCFNVASSKKDAKSNCGFFNGRGIQNAQVGCGQVLSWDSVVLENFLKAGS